MNINFSVGNVVVAADDEAGLLLPHRADVFEELVKPLVFVNLPLVAGRAGGKVCVDQREVGKICADYATLRIALKDAIPVVDSLWRPARQDGHATIPFLLGRKPKGLVSKPPDSGQVNIGARRFGFLEADNVRRVGLEPIEQALFYCGADAVHVV